MTKKKSKYGDNVQAYVELLDMANKYDMGGPKKNKSLLGDAFDVMREIGIASKEAIAGYVKAQELAKETNNIPVKYNGGPREETWNQFWQEEPVLQHAVDSVADLYGINPEIVKYRLNHEGIVDQLVSDRNKSIEEGKGIPFRGYNILNDQTLPGRGFGSYGFDDYGTYLNNGFIKLADKKRLYFDGHGGFTYRYPSWYTGEGTNEHGRLTLSADGEDNADAFGMMAAGLKAFRDQAKIDFPNASESDLDRYALAYYNRGVTGGRDWVRAGAKGYNFKAEGGSLKTKSWNDLSMKEKSEMIKVGVKNGLTRISDIRDKYNEFADGGYLDEDVNIYGGGGNTKKRNRGSSQRGFYMSPNAQYAMRYFMDKGMPLIGAAGLVGGFMRESSTNLSTGALNPSSKAIGIAQWLGPRKKELIRRYGPNPTLQQQLDFVWYELNTSYRKGLNALMNAKTPTEAADAALGWYEFSVGPQGAVKAFNDTGQNGMAALNRGRQFTHQILGLPVPEAITLEPHADSQKIAELFNYANMGTDYELPTEESFSWLGNSSDDIEEDSIDNVRMSQNDRIAQAFKELNEERENKLASKNTGKEQKKDSSIPDYLNILSYLHRPKEDSKFSLLSTLGALSGNSKRLFGDGGDTTFPWQDNRLAQAMAANMQALQEQKTEEAKRIASMNSAATRQKAREVTLAKGKALVERDTRNYYTASNDATAVTRGRTQNTHLKERGLEGAKKKKADDQKFAEEHPVINAVENVASVAPFILPAMGLGLDAAASTAAGQAVTSGLNWMANVAKATPWIQKAWPWVDAGLTSYFGAHGIEDTINRNFNLMTPLELAPLGRVASPVAKGAYNTMHALYDNGTIWDKYTTFRGRFGNYGDNLATNIYGTLARNYGLPDKARIPADAMRKVGEPVRIENGLVDFTGDKSFGGNPHINMTLDRPTVSHHWWVGDGADTYIMPTNSFIKQTGKALKSIEPSDMFANGARVQELPQNVTLISGDIEALNKAREAGMQTLSSPRLRRMYKHKINEYQQELSRIANLSPEEQAMVKPPVHPKVVKNDRGQNYWPEYASEVQRLQARRGTPTFEDFRLLEQQTGLNAGVAPISEYYNALNQIRTLPFDENGVILPLVYPNGREAVISSPSKWQKEERLLKTPYNKVFYDPASTVESDWKTSIGINN